MTSHHDYDPDSSLDPTTGGSDDWAYLAGITRSFALELRDTGNFGFLLPPSEIRPQGEEFVAAINAVMTELAR